MSPDFWAYLDGIDVVCKQHAGEFGVCRGRMIRSECLCLSKVHLVEKQMLKVILGGGAFKKLLGHEDWDVMSRISEFTKETQRHSLPLLPQEIAGEACVLDKGPAQTTMGPWFWTLSLQISEKYISTVYKLPNLLQQPKWAKIITFLFVCFV